MRNLPFAEIHKEDKITESNYRTCEECHFQTGEFIPEEMMYLDSSEL